MLSNEHPNHNESTSTDFFYQNIPESLHIEDVFNTDLSSIVPNDWILIITDVVQSTQAIEEGQYRDVNTTGGLTVMAIANVLQSMDFPFIFGGDGVTMLIPAHWEALARDVLLDTQEKVLSAFNLQIRVGIVPIQTLQAAGYELRISKLRLSPQYTQAIIDGDGLEVAEAWVKSSAADNPFLVVSATEPETKADFGGFTCRWQDVPSAKGEIICLIIKFRTKQAEIRKTQLSAFLAFLTRCYGLESDYHPIETQQMHAGGVHLLWREIKIHSINVSWLKRFLTALKISFQVALIRILQWLRIPLQITSWMNVLEIKEQNVVSSDFRKFDGALKMVISGTTASREQLINYLETQYKKGQLFYGLHVTNRAHLTCLMHVESCGEVHFVDGAEGGYAMAAKQLKAQIAGAGKGE